jgi:hypothetical protein
LSIQTRIYERFFITEEFNGIDEITSGRSLNYHKEEMARMIDSLKNRGFLFFNAGGKTIRPAI